MTKSKVVLAIHGNWATQRRQPIIEPDHDTIIRDSIAGQLRRLHCPFIAFGAAADHVHVLFLLRSTRSCEQVFRSLKAASAVAVQRQIKMPFHWQQGYAAFSVSPPLIPKARDYVLNQRIHHAEFTTIGAYE